MSKGSSKYVGLYGIPRTEAESHALHSQRKRRAERRAAEKHLLEYDVARYIQRSAQPTTREIATAMKWSLVRTRTLLLGMAEREFFPYGMLAYNDIGSAVSGARPGRQSPNEYVWFFT